MRGEGVRAFLVVALCLVTYLFFSNVARFTPIGDNLIVNGGFSDSLAQWRVGRAGEVTVADGVVTLTQKTGARSVWISQMLPRNLDGYFRFTGDIRSIGVVPGEHAWNRARLLLISKDERGKSNWKVPHNLVTRAGTVEWNHVTKDFKVYEGITGFEARALLSRASGSMQIRNISLIALSANENFETAKNILLLLWLLVALYVLAPVMGHLLFPFTLSKIFLLLVVVIMVGATLLSTPYLNKVKSGVEKVVIATGLSPQGGTADDPLYDWKSAHKIGHFVGYTLVAASLFFVFPTVPWFRMLLYLLLFAATTETLQLFSEGRTSQISDFLVNMVGVITGTMLYFPFGLLRQRSR